MDSFRCIHVARLLLDHQLHGLKASIACQLDSDVRKIIQDATLIAFGHVVDEALARDVHCVLISQDWFDPDDRGLRGPAALVRGIGRLAEQDIAVVLKAGRPDLWSSWPAGLRFPPNARRVGGGLATSVSIAREGKLLATIAIGDSATPGATPAVPDDAPAGCGGWQIHLPTSQPPGPGTIARTIHLHDDRGPAQGLRPDETGPHGFTYVEIDSVGEPHHTFVAAAPVRWERFAVSTAPETIRDDLLQNMASQLEQTRREPCEKVWLIAWDVTGSGLLFERLENRDFCTEFLAELAELDPVPGVRIYTHAVRRHTPIPLFRSNAGSGAGIEATGPAKNLAEEFGMRLEERFADPEKAMGECLADAALAGGPWQVEIESLFAELDAGEVAHDARRMAMHWFAGQEELSS